MSYKNIFKSLNIDFSNYKGKDLKVYSPVDGALIATLKYDSSKSYQDKALKAKKAFKQWQDVPAPIRGELIRIFANQLRKIKNDLGSLVAIESGKILEEGKGEVQEMIDICDYAVGLSRSISGLTLPSERNNHTMEENWRPLGVVGVISAFNFPVAVWAWNFALAIICGNSVIWKPSSKTPICAIACKEAFDTAIKKYKHPVPDGLFDIFLGDNNIKDKFINDKQIALISATGSSKMGKILAPKIAKRFGKSLFELGGNNATIITPSADFNITLPCVLFGAVGTAGQRCTTTRRALVHKDIYYLFFDKLHKLYNGIYSKIGTPLDKRNLVGPLIDKDAYNHMQNAIKKIKKQGGEVYGGKRILVKEFPKAFYVTPAIVKIPQQTQIVTEETFAPILYIIPFDNLDQAIDLNNSVPQGLSSSIFSNDIKEIEKFKKYSDCGITNVNIGTSGAEIGGAFGGEKETGGGRESGSDSWKSYMRRQTCTTYYGQVPPDLAQGIKFE